ncbi:hypothetical protein FBU30_003704 [Linnemannia zychae]|nr:hypothetical protein FBU30_003704 [Linnemannia zychae]
MAAIQVGAIYATRSGIDRNVPGAVEAAGIIPIVLLVLGFVPQYIDIYRDRSVVGVSMVFIAADASGAVFSIISLIFRTEFDLLATLNYCAVLVCDFIIVFFYVYYNKMNPSMARVRGAPKARDLENGEIESGIVTVVESEVGENKDMESEKTVEHIQKLNLHGTAAPNHLVESVTKTTTASQVSLSSNHSNSTVAQA